MATLSIKTTEMHTGGEPLRIVDGGLPVIQGATLLDKRRYIRENLDKVRQMVLFEPRGHDDMFGVIVVDADLPEAAMGCIFITNEGYGNMCGHGVIALGRYVIDKGIVKNPISPETSLVLQCPCGPVETFVQYEGGKTGAVRFNSVPSFVYALDATADVPGIGRVTFDISYGGNFYVMLPAEQLGMDMDKTSVTELATAGHVVFEYLKKTLTVKHPKIPEVSFLYGVVLIDSQNNNKTGTHTHLCLFGSNQVDRSPCGSSITSRVALQVARGEIQMNESRTFKGPVGSKFIGTPIKQLQYGGYDSVIVEISGKANYTGSSTFAMEDDDDVGTGFLLR